MHLFHFFQKLFDTISSLSLAPTTPHKTRKWWLQVSGNNCWIFWHSVHPVQCSKLINIEGRSFKNKIDEGKFHATWNFLTLKFNLIHFQLVVTTADQSQDTCSNFPVGVFFFAQWPWLSHKKMWLLEWFDPLQSSASSPRSMLTPCLVTRHRRQLY